MLNENQFTEFLKQYGFQTLVLSEMEIKEQLELVVNAEWFISVLSRLVSVGVCT